MLRPDFTGIWKADLTRTKLLGPTPAEIGMRINHAEPALSAEMFMATADGGKHHIAFSGKTTGEPADNVILGVPWRSQLAWTGSELLIESHVSQNGRELHFKDFWSLSADGEILTMVHRDDDLAGQITVLGKVRDAKQWAEHFG